MQFYARPIINNAAPILHATRARRPADPVRRGGGVPAGRLRADKAAAQADASGDIRRGNAAGDSLATSELHLQLESHTGYAGTSSYTLAHGLVRGDAERIELA